MKRTRFQGGLAAFLLAASLAAPTSAARVEINGAVLDANEGWVENGTSYVTLHALSREGDYRLTWDGTQACLEGEDFILWARPGTQYIEVNGRALYVPDGVSVVDNRTALPLRLLEDALGGEVTWNERVRIASFDVTQAQAERADYPEEDLYWLARVISAESRGESLLGQIAVGNVVLNRVASPIFPNSVHGVLAQKSQFSTYKGGKLANRTPNEGSIIAAKLVLDGGVVEEVKNALWFDAMCSNSWAARHKACLVVIGGHKFYG